MTAKNRIPLSTPVMFELDRIRAGLSSIIDHILSLEVKDPFHNKYREYHAIALRETLQKCDEVDTLVGIMGRLSSASKEVYAFLIEIENVAVTAFPSKPSPKESAPVQHGNLLWLNLNGSEPPEAVVEALSQTAHGAGFVVLRSPDEINKFFSDLVNQARAFIQPTT